MKIGYIYNEIKNILVINYEIDFSSGDVTEYVNHKNNTIKLVKRSCRFCLPSGFKSHHLHNDLVALSSLLIIYPFIGTKIEFLFPISDYFYKNCLNSGKRVSYRKSKHSEMQIRTRTLNTESLAYSGGIDSTAASISLPENTWHIFLDRINPITKGYFTYHKDQIYYSMDYLLSNNKRIIAIKSDMEYMREPVGFIFDLACGVPNIILSQYLNFKNINYGYVIHHFDQLISENLEYYCLGQWKLFLKPTIHTKKISVFSFWDKLFKAVDLKLKFPLEKMTEFDTFRIVNSSNYKGHFNSCMRGFVKNPCKKCKKCCKLMLINFALTKDKKVEDFKKIIALMRNVLVDHGYRFENITDYGNFELLGIYLAYNWIKQLPELQSIYNDVKNYKSEILSLTNKII